MKVLILSCSTGEGHNSCAYAMREEFKRRGIVCYVHDALSFSSVRREKIIKAFFTNVALKYPSLFGMMYRLGSDVSKLPTKSPIYYANLEYAKNIANFINENQIDAIVCTHLFPMEALTYLRRNNLIKAKTYAILTDYTAIPFIEETLMDAYFIPHKDLLKEFIDKGMDEAKIVPIGIPVSAKYNVKYDKEKASDLLSLPKNKKIILIMTGGLGCGDVLSLISSLISLKDVLIIVLTGRNNELKEKIDNVFENVVLTQSFTDKVCDYMASCDVLLSKPGGLSSTEAVVLGVPLIHTMAIPGCETLNATFFKEHGISMYVNDLTKISSCVEDLLNDKKRRDTMLLNQREVINHQASSDIVDYIENNLEFKG